MSSATLPPLLLTGGPAVGKSSTAAILAATTERCAVIDVDDIRHLVVSGGTAPWSGRAGQEQQLLGVRNTVCLADNFINAGFDVVICDVATTAALIDYRAGIPGLIAVRLSVGISEARRRSRMRTEYLTSDQFDNLHVEQTAPLAVDHDVDVTDLTLDEQAARVRELWQHRT